MTFQLTSSDIQNINNSINENNTYINREMAISEDLRHTSKMNVRINHNVELRGYLLAGEMTI